MRCCYIHLSRYYFHCGNQYTNHYCILSFFTDSLSFINEIIINVYIMTSNPVLLAPMLPLFFGMMSTRDYLGFPQYPLPF